MNIFIVQLHAELGVLLFQKYFSDFVSVFPVNLHGKLTCSLLRYIIVPKSLFAKKKLKDRRIDRNVKYLHQILTFP